MTIPSEMIKAIANDSKVRIDRIVANYEQLEKENAELKEKACCIIEDLKALYFSPVVTKDDLERQDKILAEAEQFLKDSEVEK